jgi:hypothetical protein
MRTKIISILVFFLINTICVADITVIHNIKGNTINQIGHVGFEAIAFENGKVLAIGTSKDLSQKFPKAISIDGQGKAMLPGLHDAHAHIMSLARLKNQVDLAGINSLEETLQKIKEYADSHPNSQWILGRGWNQVLWKGKKFPTKQDLDALNIKRPIWLRRIDGHAGWANSQAMQIAGSSGIEKDIPGGEIINDAQGRQTGIFVDNAMDVIGKEIPQENAFETIDTMLYGLQFLASLGLTTVDDAGINYQTYQAYKLLDKHNLMPIRVNAMVHSGAKHLDKMLEKPYHGKGELLQIHSIKYVFDGALGSRGAAMLKPYSDRADTTGLIVQTQDFVQNLIYKNAQNGWQAAIHAIGDKANRMALNALADPRALSETNRNRVEHAQIVDVNDLHMFKDHHIIASMQPTHATSDKNMAEDRIGKQRLKGAYAWQTLEKQGVVIASGSDFPVEYPNPFFGLHAAVTRQDRNNQPPNGWIPEERLSLEQALASFTINAAYADRHEKTLGSLEPGKWADFILVDQDLFNIPEQDIWKTQVIETWIAGKKVFEKKH